MKVDVTSGQKQLYVASFVLHHQGMFMPLQLKFISVKCFLYIKTSRAAPTSLRMAESRIPPPAASAASSPLGHFLSWLMLT